MMKTISEASAPQPIVGVSKWAQTIHAEIDGVAPYPSNVLICGPTGTGKELIAQQVHRRSNRSDKPFVAVNCAAIAPSLFESQMFGHVKGAFTSADSDALGYFRAADGGTLFLDEIGELELSLQAKLLRVLQEGAITPVGGHDSVGIDVRIVAATNRNLADEVTRGRFRQDLYYRLAVAMLHTLPLVDRPEDLQLLAQFLITRLCHKDRMPFKPLSPEAEARLLSHIWPGNVRELQNVLERALMLAKGAMVEAKDIVFVQQPGQKDNHRTQDVPTVSAENSELQALASKLGKWPTLKQFERYILQRTLERTSFNQAEAARILDINRGSLYRRVKEYHLSCSNTRQSALEVATN